MEVCRRQFVYQSLNSCFQARSDCNYGQHNLEKRGCNKSLRETVLYILIPKLGFITHFGLGDHLKISKQWKKMQFQFVRRASLESDDRVKIYVMLWKNSFTFLMKQSASVFVFLLLSLWRALWRILRAKIEILAVSPLAPSLNCWDCFVVIFFLSMPSKVTVLGHDSESFKPLPIDSGPKLCPRK